VQPAGTEHWVPKDKANKPCDEAAAWQMAMNEAVHLKQE
jgi:hypothetical protein